MSAAMLIAGKDLRQRLRDRSAVLVVLVIPFVLAAILGLTLGNATEGKVKVNIAVVNADRGRAASAFTSLVAGLERKGLFKLRSASSLGQARALAKSGKIAAAFYIPSGFSRAVERGAGANVMVIGDPGHPIGTLVARSVAQSYTNQLSGIRLALATVASSAGPGVSLSQLEPAAAAIPDPIAVEDVSAKRKELDATTFYAAGMGVFFLFFTVQFGISTLLDERRDGTLARLLAAPVRASTIIAGKALTSVILGIVGMVALYVASTLLLGADWGNPLGVALLIIAGVLAATALMALVITLARTPEQAGYWQAIVALVLGMLGGTFFPVSQAGGAVQTLSQLTPQAWFLHGLRDLAGGAGASAALGPVCVILVFACVFAALGIVRAGRLIRP